MKSDLARVLEKIEKSFGLEAVAAVGILAFFGVIAVMVLAAKVAVAILGEVRRSRSRARRASETSTTAASKKVKLGKNKDVLHVDDLVAPTSTSASQAPKGKQPSPNPSDAGVRLEDAFSFTRPANVALPSSLLRGFQKEVLCLGGSRSGFLLASHDRVVRLYGKGGTTTTGTLLPLGPRTVANVGFSDDGDYFGLYFTEENSVSVYGTRSPTNSLFSFKSSLPADVDKLHVLPEASGVVTLCHLNNFLALHSAQGKELYKGSQKIGRLTAWACRQRFVALAGTEVDDVRFLEVIERQGSFVEVKRVTYFVFPRTLHLAFTKDHNIVAINDAGLMTQWRISDRYFQGDDTRKYGTDFIDADFGKKITFITSSPDGKHLAIVAGPHLTIYAVNQSEGFKIVRDFHNAHPGLYVQAVVFEPSGKKIVTYGSGEKVAKVWDF